MFHVWSRSISGGPLPAAARLQLVGVAIFALPLLSGCADLVGELLGSSGEPRCHDCTWIIQEWETQGWTTYNSAPYNSDALCEQSLTTQSTAHHKRGYRCVLAEYTDQKVSAAARSNVTYVGFEWKVESAESHGWEYTGETTYRNEALCQQSLWHQSKINPNRDYRCISGDYR